MSNMRYVVLAYDRDTWTAGDMLLSYLPSIDALEGVQPAFDTSWYAELPCGAVAFAAAVMVHETSRHVVDATHEPIGRPAAGDPDVVVVVDTPPWERPATPGEESAR